MSIVPAGTLSAMATPDEFCEEPLQSAGMVRKPDLSPQLDAFIVDRFSTTLEDPSTGRRLSAPEPAP